MFVVFFTYVQIVDKLVELFPENLTRGKALAEIIYEKGFMQENITSATECLAPLFGILSSVEVPEPRQPSPLMTQRMQALSSAGDNSTGENSLERNNLDDCRTMYEYLIDGYSPVVSFSLLVCE